MDRRFFPLVALTCFATAGLPLGSWQILGSSGDPGRTGDNIAGNTAFAGAMAFDQAFALSGSNYAAKNE
jgi:hypothetical protein